MFDEKTYSLYNKVICFIIIAGFIIGILGGISFMGPSAENIENATRYPALYGDQLFESHWTMNSMAVMVGIWAVTAFVALLLHGQKMMLNMQEFAVRTANSDDETEVTEK